MGIKVSVIVPVYNVELYIEQCIVSILNQTLKNIEIIIINDGTLDRSIQNIEYLIRENSNIKLINKNNGGLSSARNEGIKYARGEYISFIDSDDYILEDFLEKLYNEAKKYDLDIVCGSHTRILDGKRKITKDRNKLLYTKNAISGEEFLYKQLNLSDYRMEVWDDLYKRDFLIKNNLKFRDNLIYEDEEFTPNALLKAKRVKLIDNYGYMYRKIQTGITGKKPTIKNVNSIITILNELKEKFYLVDSEEAKISLSKLILYLLNGLIATINRSNIENKYKLYKDIQINEYIDIINYGTIISFQNKVKFDLLKFMPRLFSYLLMVKYKLS